MNNREEKGGSTEPYIFIIDLDGTIIGDCNYQCDLYNIIELIIGLNVNSLDNNNNYNSNLLFPELSVRKVCENLLTAV